MTTKGTRTLYFPKRVHTEKEFVAQRTAHRAGHPGLNESYCYSEETFVLTARELLERGMDGANLLHIFKQPAPDLGVEPEDVYGSSVGEPRFPDERVRIEMDDVRWVSSFCRDAIQRLEPDLTNDGDEYRQLIVFLRNLRSFCDTAVDLGIRPALR